MRTIPLLLRVGRALQSLPRSRAWLPVVGWMALIWALSSMPSDDEPGLHISPVLGNLAHAPIFGLLALWLALLIPRGTGWPRVDAHAAARVMLVVLAYAGIDEWHQSWIPGRDPSVFDVGTDLVGAACTLWIIAYVDRSAASENGLWRRLGICVLLCTLAAWIATVPPW